MEQSLAVHRFQAMASPIEVQATLAGSAWQSLFAMVEAEFAASEQCLSRFRETSELVQLNRSLGQWTAVSARLYEAASLAYRAYRLTRGLFDPRVIAVLANIGYPGVPLAQQAFLMEDPSVAAPRSLNAPWFAREPRNRRLRLAQPIDLGGIGKGLTVRRASRLAKMLTDSFIINAGGDLFASGEGPDDSKWTFGIENPSGPAELAVAVRVPGGRALCTSSTKNRHWQQGTQRVHHLIHPYTGQPGGGGLVAVTVLGKDPMWSEIATKYLFLLGPEGIGSVASALQLPVWWFYDTGEIGMTQQAVPYMTWLHSDLRIRETV